MADFNEFSPEFHAAVAEAVERLWDRIDPQAAGAPEAERTTRRKAFTDFLIRDDAARQRMLAFLVTREQKLRKDFEHRDFLPIAADAFSRFTQGQGAAPTPPPAPEGVPAVPRPQPDDGRQDTPSVEGDEPPGFSAATITPPSHEHTDEPAGQSGGEGNESPARRGVDMGVFHGPWQPTNWAAIPHILTTTPEDMARVDRIHRTGRAFRGAPPSIQRIYVPESVDKVGRKVEAKVVIANMLPFNASSFAYLATRYGSYERDPKFLAALERIAHERGLSVQDLLNTKTIRMKVNGVEQDVDVKDLINDTYMSEASLAADPVPDFTHKLVGFGIVSPAFYKRIYRSLSWRIQASESGPVAPQQFKNGGVMFVDQHSNTYLDTGKKISVLLAPEQTFNGNHALNMMRAFVAGRFNPQSDGVQTMKFRLSGGHPLSRIFGSRGKDAYLRDLTLICALNEMDRARDARGNPRIHPDIEVRKWFGLVKLERIVIQGDNTRPTDYGIVLNRKAYEEMVAKGIPVDRLVAEFNDSHQRNRHQHAVPAVEGDPLLPGDPGGNPSPQTPPQTGTGGNASPLRGLEVAALAAGGIGAAVEFAHGKDLSAERAQAAASQAEMKALDAVLKDTQDHDARNRLLNGLMTGEFNADHLRAVINEAQVGEIIAALPAHRADIDSRKGLEPGTAVPAYGAILESRLVAGGMPAEEAGILREAATLTLAAARMKELMEDPQLLSKWPDMRSKGETPEIRRVAETFNALKKKVASGETAAAKKDFADIVPTFIRQAQAMLDAIGRKDPARRLGEIFAPARATSVPSVPGPHTNGNGQGQSSSTQPGENPRP